ncbi:MAG: hypothetical protein IPL78_22870 [Chloroflexi bacterium]|nr:hypothetical protein [Chloroflexota bacterium]
MLVACGAGVFVGWGAGVFVAGGLVGGALVAGALVAGAVVAAGRVAVAVLVPERGVGVTVNVPTAANVGVGISGVAVFVGAVVPVGSGVREGVAVGLAVEVDEAVGVGVVENVAEGTTGGVIVGVSVAPANRPQKSFDYRSRAPKQLRPTGTARSTPKRGATAQNCAVWALAGERQMGLV